MAGSPPTSENYAIRYARWADHFIGGDPLMMRYYPPVSATLEGVIVRLDVAPRSV